MVVMIHVLAGTKVTEDLDGAVDGMADIEAGVHVVLVLACTEVTMDSDSDRK